MFDPEHAIALIASFKFDNDIIISSKEGRVMWETYSSEEFHFWSSVRSLLQLEAILRVNADLNLLLHDSCLILSRLKLVLFNIIWRIKYNVLVDSKGDETDQLKSSHLVYQLEK